MKKIKIAYTDCFNYDLTTSALHKVLAKNFDVEISSDPDYVVDFGYGYDHLDPKYDNCIKIAISGENDVPSFSFFDYVIAHPFVSFGDRYCRLPIFAHWRGQFMEYLSDGMGLRMTDEQLLNRKFCSIVVSNVASGAPIREYFFRELSKYKTVDSGGRLWNNVGGPVADKLKFCEGYKFNIAFENSVAPGYTTEKVMESFAANTLPIYYGNPIIEKDFNRDAMVVVHSMEDVDRAIEEIKRLDQDDTAYLSKMKMRKVAIENPSEYLDNLERFFVNIFSQDKEAARRLCLHGREPGIREEICRFKNSYDKAICRRLFAKARSFIGKIFRFLG